MMHDWYFKKISTIFFCFLCGILLLGMPLASFAEDTKVSVDFTGNEEGYSAVLYNNTNGLPTSEANAIAQTAEGFIWIGGYSGLMRYDGNTFERIDSTSGLTSVMYLYIDSKERLWVGTNDSGAAVMMHGEFQYFNKTTGLNSLSVRSIAEDENGNIYIATTQGVALIDENLELHTINEPQINKEYILNIVIGADNIIYGVTQSGAVFTLKDGKLLSYYDGNKLGIEDVHAILPDKNRSGYLYLGTKKSKVYYGRLDNGLKDKTITNISPIEYVNSISQIGNQTWICTDTGIGVLEDNKFTPLSHVPMNSSVEHAMTDYQGNLWFVSSKQGVMKIVPNQFLDLFEKAHLDENVVNSTCDYQGKLFIGTKNDGIIVINWDETIEKLPIEKAVSASGNDLRETDLIEMLNDCRVRSIIKDNQDNLWISTFGECALLKYDGKSVTQFGEAEGLPSDRVRTVFERKDGSYMIACTGGMVLLKNNKVVKVYDESSGIENTEILTVTEAENGDMLIGTDGGGIYIINDTKISHIGTESGLSSDVVMKIKKDVSRNLFWLVTSNSISYMTEDYQVTTVKNFPYSNNFDLYENSQGEMWILSSNGIYVANIEELLRNEEISPVFYGRDDGLPCIATANSYSELSQNGDLYISGTTGVAKVNINKPFETVEDIKADVPYVEADGNSVYPDENGVITVPSDVKKLTIHSFIYNYSLMNPQVTYYLQGFDNTETTIKRSDLSPISYTNLKGGNYHFIMQIKDEQGKSDKSISVSIVKPKVFYEKLWFYILCSVIIAMISAFIVLLLIRRREQALLKKQKEQKILIREIVEAFAKVIDMKDKYTNGHSARVAEYTAMLTRELGYDEETVDTYYNIALLHDIGKVGIPAEVLNKPGKLTDEEFKIIKSHAMLGYDTLKNISIMPELATGAGAHHERPDGKGYPNGLKGEEIPRVAQIIAVADAFDAMYSNRPYRKRMNFEKAVSIIEEVSGTQLTSDVVEAFLRLVKRGYFRAPDDNGGGTTENIDNIHKKFQNEA